MELEHGEYIASTAKPRRGDRRKCGQQSVVNEFCWPRDRLVVATFERVWDKVPEGSILIFGDTRVSL